MGPGLTHALHLLELAQGGPHDLLQVDETLDDPLDDGVREAGQAVEQPVAAGLDPGLGVVERAGQPEDLGHLPASRSSSEGR